MVPAAAPWANLQSADEAAMIPGHLPESATRSCPGKVALANEW
jgi:hypothetical protein